MRKLNKGAPLADFMQYLKRHNPRNWKEFSDGCGTLKQEMRRQMLDNEQGNLCGYTELVIKDSEKCHIDHFRKKSERQFHQFEFDWNNFVVATMDDDFGARYKDHKSGISAAEYLLLLNPVIDHAESYFEYTLLGDIIPKRGLADEQKALAKKTIDVFNLKHLSLREKRYGLIKLIEEYGDTPPDVIRECVKSLGFKSLVEQYTQEE